MQWTKIILRKCLCLTMQVDRQVDRTTLSLNNKCSVRRQRRRIIKREAWTATTLKFKGWIHRIHGSFQESFPAHNSTLLLDKISDLVARPSSHRVFSRCHKTFSRSAGREWLKYPRQSTSYIRALNFAIKQIEVMFYLMECITMVVFTVAIIDSIHVLEDLFNLSLQRRKKKRGKAHNDPIQFEHLKSA